MLIDSTKIYIGTHELKRLWAADSKLPVRSLGYAFHVIPGLLRTPERFDSKGYQFCFRIVAAHWNEFSSELQHAFSDVVGLELAAITQQIGTDGFVVNMWGQVAE